MTMHIQKLEKDGSLIVSGPVFIPGSLDCEASLGEKPLPIDVIQRLKEDFQDYKLVDLEHQFFTTGKTIGEVLDSQILSEPTVLKLNLNSTETLYPKGTWIVTLQITDPQVIEGILNGEYIGLSPTTINRSYANNLKMMMSTKSKIHRVLVSDIPDPVTVTISVTSQPCNPGAKFCSFKDNDTHKSKSTCGCEKMTNVDEQLDGAVKSFINSIKEIFTGETKPKKEADEPKEEVNASKEEASPKEDEPKKDANTKSEEPIEEEVEVEEEVEYVTKEDFEAFKQEIRDIIKEALAPKEEEPKKEEKPVKEDEPKIKASSKSNPVHETEETQTKMSDTATVYSIMGRNTTGSAKKH